MIDDTALVSKFIRDFDGYYVATDQVFVYEYDKILYVLTIEKVLGT